MTDNREKEDNPMNDNSTIDFHHHEDDDNLNVRSSNSFIRSIRSFLVTVFPIFGWLPYCFTTIFNDIIAGIYIGLYQIPQCIAYSIIAEYPLAHTIHTNVISSILYALIGANRRFSYGTFSLVSATYMGIILRRINNDFDMAENVVIVVTFTIGICCMMAGLLRIGSMVRFIPYEILSGFRAGLYLLIITLQICSMAGFHQQWTLGDGKSIMIIPNLYRNNFYKNLVTMKHINWNSWIVSIGCLALLTLFRLFHYYWQNIFNYRLNWLRQIVCRIPIEFILISISIIVVCFVDVKKYKIYTIDGINFGNETLIDMSSNFHLEWPPISQYINRIWFECITATLLFLIYMHSLAIDLVIKDTEEIHQPKFAKRKHQLWPKQMKFYRLGWKTYNINNELLYKGIIDLFGSFMKCLPSGPSKIRSDRMRNVGACTQISSLIASTVTLAIWLTLQTFIAKIPKCIIASIVAFDTVVALIEEIGNVKNFWKTSILDIVIWTLTFVSFILLNIEISLYCSLGLSLIIYCLRYRPFESFTFSIQKALITKTNLVLLVSRNILHSKFDHHHHNGQDDDDVDDDDDNECNILKTLPSSTLKTINIFHIDKRILTIANIDSFVRDVCRKVSDSCMLTTKSNDDSNSMIMNRKLIFDCRSISYLDWPSIRAIKGTIMRTIQICESWQQSNLINKSSSSSSALTVTTDLSNNNDHDHDHDHRMKQSSSKQQQQQHSLVVMFIFHTRLVQIIHNAGEFSIHFYHSLHQSLHIGLKAAINMAITIPMTNSNRYDTLETLHKQLRLNSSSDEEKIPTTMTTTTVTDIQSSTTTGNNNKDKKSGKIKEKKLKNFFNKRVIELEMESNNSNNDDNGGGEKRETDGHSINDKSTVLPISFKRQNSIDHSEQQRQQQQQSSSNPSRFQIINQQSLNRNYAQPPPLANESIVHNKLSKSIPPPPPPEPKFTYSKPGVWKKSEKSDNKENQQPQPQQRRQPDDEEQQQDETTSFSSMSDFKKHLESLFIQSR
ncbi:uncharacterized protein LOC124498352 [Dermatophagoides farinae]|uniref:uncharacterized protein LOC124498352 n=1 Tax=Dermatophagoides farinae TaxID=6954 RepID=UPI003F611D2C